MSSTVAVSAGRAGGSVASTSTRGSSSARGARLAASGRSIGPHVCRNISLASRQRPGRMTSVQAQAEGEAEAAPAPPSVDLEALLAGPTPRIDMDEEEDELDGWVLMDILNQDMPDVKVNELVWKCLGYKWDPSAGAWDNSAVFPKWRATYPEPPDLVGVTRTYLPEVDGPVLKANQALVRSIPQEHKQNLKVDLKGYGFKGFSMDGLTPNKTRRAQCCNWLLFYKKQLRGKTLEQLKAEQAARKAAGLQTVRERPIMEEN